MQYEYIIETRNYVFDSEVRKYRVSHLEIGRCRTCRVHFGPLPEQNIFTTYQLHSHLDVHHKEQSHI